MEQLSGKVVVVTGAASGIGLALAKKFGAEGMKVVMADIEVPALEIAAASLPVSVERITVVCDVSKGEQIDALRASAIDAFGAVHVVCNNAGVGAGGPVDDMKPSDWDWTFQVNLMGVIYGLEAFLPHIRAHGEGGAIINTASMAGHMSPPGMEAYSASKFAVVALTEGWAAQLAPENIQVQVLCPGFVRTGINQSGRNRPAKFGGPQLREIVPDDRVANGIDPARVGARVLEALQAGDLYIFTHPDMRPFVQMRFQKIMEGFDSADRSTALSGLEYRTPDLDLLP